MDIIKSPLLFSLSFFLYSCSTGVSNTYMGGFDPLYKIKNAKTVGFTPFCWGEYRRCELHEKQAYISIKNELESRGYSVFYIEPNFLVRKGTMVVHVKNNYNKMPDLTVTFDESINIFKTRVAGYSTGSANINAYGGNSNHYSTEGYTVNNKKIMMDVTLWAGAPKYMKKVWEGIAVTYNPSVNNDTEFLSSQIKDIFKNKFDK